MNENTAVSALLSSDVINSLALPSNLRYGHRLFERGAVELIEVNRLKVEGWVGGLSGSTSEGGGQRRRVQLTATAKGLKWHCTGNPKNHQIFCKHCVALALALMNKHK